jgi:glycosyltransferase involved in cell wall biosynthesis
MRKDISRVKALLFTAFEWFGAIKKCDYIACSASEQKETKSLIPFRKCHLVENAVDISAWENVNAFESRKNVIITVGQIRTQKDPLRFAAICAMAKANKLSYEFVWVGDGDDIALKNALINSGVNVLGWKTPVEVKYLLSESKVYLSTALWEGLPVSPIEAMLSGCVAVLSDCAGNRDIINNGINGYSFDSVDEAIDVLSKLECDVKLMESISNSGNEHAKKQYSLERYSREMNILIEKDI